MNPQSLIVSYPYQDLCLCDLEGEIWRDVIGYEGYYQISNLGRVKSLPRFVVRRNQTVSVPERMRRQSIVKDKHTRRLVFSACVDDSACNLPVARVVYSAFIKPLPDFKKKRLVVMHKDDDLMNNRVENLYVFTPSQVGKYYTGKGRMSPPDQSIFTPELKQKIREIIIRPVSQYDPTGKFIATYNSIADAEKCTKVCRSSIGMAARGKFKLAGGFVWCYGTSSSDLTEQEVIQKTYRRFPSERKISQYDLQGNFIAAYRTITEAARTLNIDRRSLSYYTSCSKPYQGYNWKHTIEDQI